MEFDFNNGAWVNKPADFIISNDRLEIRTEPGTDFWQRTYYGFRNENAPAFLYKSLENFTFTVKADFSYKSRFDQCGVIIYFNNQNWFKASVEYENDDFSRLGSVVTNNGYSDWSTTDISTPEYMYYRLSRRGPDFLIEKSADGERFAQMRIFHLCSAGETSDDISLKNILAAPQNEIRFGLYACSPENSSFKAEFSEFKYEKCLWAQHS